MNLYRVTVTYEVHLHADSGEEAVERAKKLVHDEYDHLPDQFDRACFEVSRHDGVEYRADIVVGDKSRRPGKATPSGT